MNVEVDTGGLTSELEGPSGFGAGGQTTIDHFQRRSEVLIALGGERWRLPLGERWPATQRRCVAETLETSHCGVAELSDDRATMMLRISVADTERRDDDLPSATMACNETTSLAAYALSVGYPVAASNLPAETRFQDQTLRDARITSAVAIPLQRGSDSYGTLLVADIGPRDYSQDEIQYIETIAHLVSTTIAHERMCQELEKERRFQTTLLQSTGSLMLVLSPEWQIVQGNRAAAQVLEFTLDDLHHRAFTTTLLADDERQSFEDALQKVPKSVGPLKLESWAITKSGHRRRIEWTLAGLMDANHQLERIVLTGLDVTRQREIETELTQVREAAGANGPQPFSPLPAGPHSDRRRRTRRSFQYVQLVAPLIEGKSPAEHEFRAVNCRDISPTGFSFQCNTPPDFQDLVVALGGQDSTTYLTARVMHATIVERDNVVSYIVGCRYLKRQQNAVTVD